jgi:hypothetical protein
MSCGFRPLPFVLYCPLSLGGSPAFPFIGSSEGREVDNTLGRCLKGEGSTGTVKDALATCSGNGQPSPGTLATLGMGR